MKVMIVSKCRKWERERRERLNEAFSELAKVLPCYDPSVNIPKLDILQKAASTIRELENNIKNLLSSNSGKKTEREDIIKKLHDRVKKLLVRNEQLSNLLRDAGISVPSACGTIKRFKRQLHWSKRISPEQAKLLQKNEMEKENISSKSIHDKKKKTKTVNMGIAPKHRTIILKGVEQKGVLQKKKKSNKKVPNSNCLIVLSQPTTTIGRDIGQQCYFVVNEPSSNMYKSIIKSGITNSGMLIKPTPITSKSRVSKSLLLINPSVPSLSPGTLLLANGTLSPTLSKFQMTSTSSNLLLNSAVCTFSKTNNKKDNECNQKHFSTKSEPQTSVLSNVKTLRYIQPKYCFTRTTQVNKVPIPALTSRYSNNYFLLNETKSECIKANEVEKIKKSNKTNQVQNSNKSNKKKGEKRKNEVEGEKSTKKSKNDIINESKSNIVTSTSDNLINTSTSPNNTPVREDDRDKLKTTNNVDSKEVDNDLIENVVTDEVKERHEYKNNNAQAKVHSGNIDVRVSTTDSFAKEQELVKHTNNGNLHEVMTFVSTVAATTLTTTTTQEDIKHLDLNLSHSELSNDIFASLQVPSGCQNPDSTSPTAAFLLAFPLVSSGIKVTEVIDGENSESQSGTPTLLQIGTMDSTKPTQSQSDTITSNFLNLDSFSFFSSKDICGNVYNNYSNTINKSTKSTSPTSVVNTNNKTDTVINKSIYVNIKSPCLPTCVAEPVKENYNIFNEKPITPKEVVGNVNSCEKRNNKIKDNTDFNLHNQTNSKVNSNYMINSKNTDHTARNFDQKSQFYVPTTYPNSNCNFSYKSEPSKMCTTCSYVNINRNYTNPLYTNCNNYNYNYHPDTNFNQNYYKNIPRNETKTYYPLNYENYSDYRKNETTALPGRYDTSTSIKEKKNNNPIKIKTTSQNKLPINWMTTPDNRLQSTECLLNSFSKGDFSQTYPFSSYVTSSSTYFTTTSIDTSNVNCVMEPKKCLDLPVVSLNSHQRPDTEEKQFSWSPTKLPHFLEPPHNFVTSTLPTLVGDLALGNPLTFGEQKNDYNKHLKDNKDFRRVNKVSNYENQTNFLSVSQLVEHNKSENVPAKTSTRRNSGNRSKNNVQHKVKRVTKYENKDLLSTCGSNNEKMNHIRSSSNYNLSNNEIFQEQKNRNSHKNCSSSYSAEALIGNQIPDESATKRYPPPSSKSLGVSSFLTENIISYFPPVDLPQENYMSQNQNYPTSNFTHNLGTSFQNNAYSTNSFIYTAPTITSTYLSTNSFEPSSHDYLQDNLNLMQNSSNKDNKHYSTKNFNNRQQTKEDKNYQHTVCSNNFRRSKKKPTNESNNGLANFDFPFLPIPGSNNSPVLPDDFHSHTNFLPPTTPFPCKNSIYPKQGNDIGTGPLLPLPPASKPNIQHPEISPSMNSAGTSLTNFNLSTIFPEINKGPITEMYTDGRIKEHSHAKSYTSTPQVSFNPEPKFSFSS